jgi:alkaline phosphatase D
MTRYHKIPFLLSFVVFYFICNVSSAQKDSLQTIVILSLDGFRWDYPDNASTPTLDRMATEGVKAISLIPSFPSKTFPNHFTIATGLVPDHHGIVNNSFFDRKIGKAYSISNKEARLNPDFYNGEPIWVTAQKQGIHTASYYWVGSDVEIQGMHPDYWKSYDESIPFVQRIDTIIKWLSLPVELRPRLVMAYYHEPDGVGHHFGPGDPRTFAVVHEIDSLTGILRNRLNQLPQADLINFIVLSDHGMGSTSSERNICLRDYIPEEWPVRIEGGNPNFNLYATSETWADSAYNKLKMIPHIRVWKPSEVPLNLNYRTNPRIGDIIVVADSAWSITLNPLAESYTGGTHGYDIKNTDIHAIFYATGPAFKKGFIHPSFQNIHIYSLLAHLLGIIPAINDGDLQQVINMLKQ